MRRARARHRRRARRLSWILPSMLVALVGLTAWVVTARDSTAHTPARSVAAVTTPAVAVTTPAGTTPTRSTASASTTSTGSATPAAIASTSTTAVAPTTSESTALTRLHSLASAYPTSATSVAAVNLDTGAAADVGATSGMTTASVVKLQLLETLLLEHQASGTTLTDAEDDAATAMIEHSDNDAAESVFWYDGGRATIVSHEAALGLSTTLTVPGSDDYWGLTTTSAAQQLVLLHDLVDSGSPLDAKSRAYALGLMREVEADQAWGVSAAADHGTDTALKNGWLGVDDDGGRWAVNSVGVVTVDGDTLLIAVMTQHDDDYASGVSRVETLARAAAAAVT